MIIVLLNMLIFILALYQFITGNIINELFMFTLVCFGSISLILVCNIPLKEKFKIAYDFKDKSLMYMRIVNVHYVLTILCGSVLLLMHNGVNFIEVTYFLATINVFYLKFIQLPKILKGIKQLENESKQPSGVK